MAELGRVVAVANQKGGVGKTTVSLMLAGYFHAGGLRCCVVDADPQGTSRQWAEMAAEGGHEAPTVMNLGKGEAMRVGLLDLRRQWPLVVVDCPPRLGGETLAAMTQATLLLMPLAPLPADAWALPETLSILAHAQGANPGVIARALLNRAGRSTLEGDIGRQIELLGVELCRTILRQRIAHSAAMVRGRSIVQYAPASEAAVEARRLGREVRGLLKLDEGTS